jgi:hypothetical protein
MLHPETNEPQPSAPHVETLMDIEIRFAQQQAQIELLNLKLQTVHSILNFSLEQIALVAASGVEGVKHDLN